MSFPPFPATQTTSRTTLVDRSGWPGRYFTAPSAPSVEDFLLDDPHIADQGYAWEIAQNPKSAMAARKGELLRSGVGGSEATLREWITLLHMEEAHDAIAEVGDSTLSEDELFHRFLEQELAAAAKPARPSTGAPPPPAAAYKEDSHTSLSDWGAATVGELLWNRACRNMLTSGLLVFATRCASRRYLASTASTDPHPGIE